MSKMRIRTGRRAWDRSVPSWVAAIAIVVVLGVALLLMIRHKPSYGPARTPEFLRIQKEVMEMVARTGGGPRMQQMRGGGGGGRGGPRRGRGPGTPPRSGQARR